MYLLFRESSSLFRLLLSLSDRLSVCKFFGFTFCPISRFLCGALFGLTRSSLFDFPSYPIFSLSYCPLFSFA
jgi:hypothetical protein